MESRIIGAMAGLTAIGIMPLQMGRAAGNRRHEYVNPLGACRPDSRQNASVRERHIQSANGKCIHSRTNRPATGGSATSFSSSLPVAINLRLQNRICLPTSFIFSAPLSLCGRVCNLAIKRNAAFIGFGGAFGGFGGIFGGFGGIFGGALVGGGGGGFALFFGFAHDAADFGELGGGLGGQVGRQGRQVFHCGDFIIK